MRLAILIMMTLTITSLYAKEWTLMVFMNGDNNLDEYAFMDLNELEVVGSNDNINIIVQYDRFQANSQANWSTAKRFYVNQDNDLNTIGSTELLDLGEVDSGDYNSVIDFVTWTKENYPADNYGLILWDHGSGWQKKNVTRSFQKSISSDDTSGNHISVSNGELETMLTSIKQTLGKKLDFLGFDACLMAMWEVAYSSENYANFMAFSEETENGEGWEYTALLSQFLTTDKTAKSLCESVVSTSLDSVGSTLSCVDLSYIPSLTEKINNFATKYKDDNSIDFEILTAYSNTLTMESEEYYKDLGMFFTELSLLVDNETKTLWIDPILTAYNQAVVVSDGNDTDIADYSKSTGLTIFMLMGGEFYDGEQSSYLNSSWSNNTFWDEFITREFQLAQDSYEPDNTMEDAYFNQNLESTNHSIHQNSDNDFVKLSLLEGYSYSFETNCSEFDTYMQLLDINGNIISEDDDSGADRCSKISYFSNIDQIVFLKIYTYDHESIAIYTLNISSQERVDDFPNSINSTEDLLTNNLIGDIEYESDIDFLYLDVTANTDYSIETLNITLDDTILAVYDSEGLLVTENDDISTSMQNYMSKVSFTPSNNERYYVSIKAYENKTGKYKIKLTPSSCEITNNGIEICDGIDNNCDNTIDEGCNCIDGETKDCGINIGICEYGTQTCVNGAFGECMNQITPEEEICDGFDNNCDGEMDEGCNCIDGETKNCGINIGICEYGTQTCVNGAFGECMNQITPEEEICDGLDNNCDGEIDEGLDAPNSDIQNSICLNSKKICDGINGWIEPNYSQILNYEEIEVSCDGIDNDCDGEIDNNLVAPNNINQKGVCKDSKMFCTGQNGWIEDYTSIDNYSTVDDNSDGLDNNCDGQIDESKKSYSGSSCNYSESNKSSIFLFIFMIILIFISKRNHFNKI